MTSFNVESEFLDLKKTYQHFIYPDLAGQGVVGVQETPQQAYQGMTQNTYLFVQEKSTLTKDIENMALYFTHKHCPAHSDKTINLSAYNSFPFQKVRDRVCFIFQKYQQQPTLLDTLLESLIQPLMTSVKHYLTLLMHSPRNTPVTQQLHWILQIVYQLTKVRGDKMVIQYFPHEVKDLYPAVCYLARERDDFTGNWESRYVILLWMGVIVLVPFDLEIIDSGILSLPKEDGTQAKEIVELMLQIGKHYLKSLTKMRQAAALFLSKLFTRPDIQKRGQLPKYISYTLDKLTKGQDNPMQNFFICGLYDSLCQIFARVQRNQLLPLIIPVLHQLQLDESATKTNSVKKQLIVKLLTQIGLTYLKPRIVTWAYRKKKVSLLSNLSSTSKTQLKTNTHLTLQTKNKLTNDPQHISDNDTNYYSDVNKNNLQDIIDMLINALSQKQTNVREQASKGLGSIAGRLSQDMVLDILQHILQLTPSPQTQHAICLTIAQLIRRNLLSPQKLSQLYPLMSQSLLYEQQQGGYSIGQAVRDAACYMCWSVARGYEQGGKQLGVSLMIAACFDREVGCRRAASAAYQQLVGRVGDVPHGIEVLTQADYFTLGLQKNAYLNVAIFVSSYEEYYKPFVQHLCHQKLRHWDIQIKRIAACSLSLMCPLNPNFISRQILPAMCKYLDNESMTTKLGTIIGISQILLGLKGLSHLHQLHDQMKDSVFLKSLTQNQKKLLKAGQYMQAFKHRYEHNRTINHLDLVDQSILTAITDNIQGKIKDGKIFKGKAGENFRIYTCRLLQCLAMCSVVIVPQQIQIFKQFIQQNLKHPQQPILFAAVKCLKPFLQTYHSISTQSKFIINLIHQAKQSQGHSRCCTLALSKLSKQIYLHHFDQIFSLAEANCKITKEYNDPEKRKYAIMVFQALVEAVTFQSELMTDDKVERVFNTLFRTIDDYTMDKRGDIGSIVRQQSMVAMLHMIRIATLSPRPRIPNLTIQNVIALLLQQLCQKIDRTRLLAGSLLQNYFDNYSQFFQIANQNILQPLFNQLNIKQLIKTSQTKIDNNLQTSVIKIQMKIQQTIFLSTQKHLIYFWNLPHSVFPLVVPLLDLHQYRYHILKGLCTSSGGISQSTIKYSLQQLAGYITKMFISNNGELITCLFEDIIKLMRQCAKDDRIIIPLYKTLDFILERDQVITWSGLKKIDTELFYLIQKEVAKTKSIVKVSAATGLYVSLLILNNVETRKQAEQSIIKILCSDLPKARKLLADKLLLVLMSQQGLFNEQQTEQLINILSENDFLDEKLNVEPIKTQILKILA